MKVKRLEDMSIDEIRLLTKADLMWLAYENDLRMNCNTDGSSGCYKCTLERIEELHATNKSTNKA